MESEHGEHQVPIWFFIGGTLLIYGLMVLGAGVYGLAYPSEVLLKLKASNPDASWFFLHADIWWGALMTVIGAFYCIRFWPGRQE
jgi:hypothetical protein